MKVTGTDQSLPNVSTGLWDGAFQVVGMYRSDGERMIFHHLGCSLVSIIFGGWQSFGSSLSTTFNPRGEWRGRMTGGTYLSQGMQQVIGGDLELLNFGQFLLLGLLQNHGQ